MNSNYAAKNLGNSNMNGKANFNQKNFGNYQNKNSNNGGTFKQPFKKADTVPSSGVNSTDKNFVPSSSVNQADSQNPTSTLTVSNPATLTTKENSKPEKIKKPRLKLDDKTLLYSENGVRKFYEIMQNTEFREKASEVNLNFYQIY
jgi:hypothetical protein